MTDSTQEPPHGPDSKLIRIQVPTQQEEIKRKTAEAIKKIREGRFVIEGY